MSESRKGTLATNPTGTLPAGRTGVIAIPRLWLAQQGGGSDEGDKRRVTVRRRRRSDTAPEERERAEAPRRRRGTGKPPAGPAYGGGSGGTGGTTGPLLPSNLKIPGGGCGLIVIIVLLLICVLPILFFLSPDEDASDGSAAEVFVTEPPPPTAPPATRDLSGLTDLETQPESLGGAINPPPPAEEGQTWLVMLYQDADDKILEQDIYVDLNEAERVGSTDRVRIVAQVDRYQAGYRGDGDWASARRYYVTQDHDLQRVGSQLVADLGEVNMADGDTLVDFVTWAIANYPADRHVLIMSDHGMGWPGGWSDPAPGAPGDPTIPLASRLGDQLLLMELDEALAEIRRQTGVEKFELIGMDACLMGHMEVFSALAPHAYYAVASQETEPALGWAYTGFLGALARNPDMSGGELGRLIVQSYVREDQRIVDEEARAEMLRQSAPMNGLMGLFGGGMTAESLARQMEQNITLTAIDLTALPALSNSLNELTFALQDERQQSVAQARSYAQSFTTVFGSNTPPSYIDLGHFVQLLIRNGLDGAAGRAADAVLASLDAAVVAEKHGPSKPGASGVSIYFPNSDLYRSPLTGAESYTAIAERFASESSWDDFLAFHYTGRTFSRAAGVAAIPERTAEVIAPGAGEIVVSPITLSDNTAGPGQPVILTADISGENIGYIYLLVGFYDEEANAIFLAERDYLESSDTRELNGVYYPVWGEGEFTLEFEWEPLMIAISDGTDSVITMLTPRSYGATFEEATYTVDGIYTYADGGESRYARLLFRDGVMQQVFGFTDQEGIGAPREIIPQSGDSFTVLENWLDLDASGNVVDRVAQEGGTLVFGQQPFVWEDLDAAPGPYVVGFIVEDLDGNPVEVYTQVTVE